MKEHKAIVEAYRKIDLSKRKVALATVVKVRGSSYRSPGARMLITDDGTWVGSISGGCLEGDALRKARQVMTEKKAITVTYDTREGSNQNLGIGLGCNGVIDVLLEPVDNISGEDIISLFEKLVATQVPVAMATIFSARARVAQKIAITEDGNFLTKSEHSFYSFIEQDLLKLFSERKSYAKEYQHNGDQVEVFLELVQPTVSLIIFGGGFDARPVSQLAKTLGWNVTVTDECVAHIAPLFFPTADKLSLCQRDYVDRDFAITPYTACILMSHNYDYDRDVLKKLLTSPAPYIGILGPRKRFDKMIVELSQQGVESRKEDLHRIHSPIGLDIGAETPDEIAVSILSEIQAKFANRSGGFLKYRNAPIHQRDSATDQVFKQVYISSDGGSIAASN